MKVTLISPPSPFLIDQKAFPPLGLLYVAGFLENNGIDINVADLAGRETELENALEQYMDADLYGITSTSPQYPQALKILKLLRRRNPKSRITIGGAYPSSLPEKCVRDGFDFVVAGEGEEAMLQLVTNREKRQAPGIIRAPYIRDMDSIPIPSRHLVDIRSFAYTIDDGSGTTLITSRGCPYVCSFCSKEVWQSGTRFHSANYVISELKHIINRYDFKHFLFLDDTITLRKKRLFELCSRMETLNIKWRCYARATTTREMLIAMKRAGCVEIGVGVESGSQKILDIVDKKETIEQNAAFVELCKQVGITANVFIMIGLPGETYETVEETRRWMERVRPHKFGFNIFMPYPGTPVYKNPNRYDIQIFDVPEEKSWVKGRQGEYESFVATNALSRNEIERLFGELFAYFTELTSWQPGVGNK
ncbi:Fe-S oxidoreductase [Candidatus Scalindua japonica]|uniref:Fe-S oxidoreductase n=1 Tax=Candidatus Scalindua japonica TaxID=1284222 RepID=A0A286TVT3_9BACT|nr:radical SAM protein [Candidatus Scalindua japonica]GAX60000.1 Fe-S oxidoreductase [Candidatus Scalindua japonica]